MATNGYAKIIFSIFSAVGFYFNLNNFYYFFFLELLLHFIFCFWTLHEATLKKKNWMKIVTSKRQQRRYFCMAAPFIGVSLFRKKKNKEF